MSKRIIHPIIMFPYAYSSKSIPHLNKLFYELRRKIKIMYAATTMYKWEDENSTDELNDESTTYKFVDPIVIINQHTIIKAFKGDASNKYQTENKENEISEFISNQGVKTDNIFPVWSTDTCQMWLYGFGKALNQSKGDKDIYWLIPGDFYYASAEDDFFANLFNIPVRVATESIDMIVGEIKVDATDVKQLIDTYGTYGLLYNWFPEQAITITKITSKPRTEFFAITYQYLVHVIEKRWFGYEQTIIILLRGILKPFKEGGTTNIQRQQLGKITDKPGSFNDLPSAMQQIERTERVLKAFYQEIKSKKEDWTIEYLRRDTNSEKIRATALIVLENALKIREN